MAGLSLRDLGDSYHPLMEPGLFSVFHDARVCHTDSVEASFDLDGICLATRYVQS